MCVVSHGNKDCSSPERSTRFVGLIACVGVQLIYFKLRWQGEVARCIFTCVHTYMMFWVAVKELNLSYYVLRKPYDSLYIPIMAN